MKCLINRHFRMTLPMGGAKYFKYPRVVCADGFSVSVQGHSSAYCSPREDLAEKYSMVELGYPSQPDELIAEYSEDSDRPTDTVYGYVPVSVVSELIEKHGGIDEKKSGWLA